LGEDRVLGQRAVLDRLVDAGHVGHGNPAGAEIHVADLGIAHLAFGQADEGLRGVDQALRTGRRQLVVVGRPRIEDGVVLGIWPVAPAIEDAEDGGTRSHYEALRGIGENDRRSTELNLFGQFRSRGSMLGFWSGTSMAQNTNSPRGSPSIEMS